MKKNLFLLLTCYWYSLNMSADNLPMKNDVIWFDKPIPSSVPPVWEYFDNLIVAGAKAQKNKDIYWENLSLPIGNGNIGANIMGSVETERITFNEKTLWRGGPNNKKGADYYSLQVALLGSKDTHFCIGSQKYLPTFSLI